MTVNLSSGSYSNMYANAFSTPMANDYFGSQVFGTNPFGYQQQSAPIFESAPNNIASALVQEYANSQYTSSIPTLQDYAQATQIANMFAGQNAMMTPYTSFTQNDIFAQQTMPYLFNNGQYIV